MKVALWSILIATFICSGMERPVWIRFAADKPGKELPIEKYSYEQQLSHCKFFENIFDGLDYCIASYPQEGVIQERITQASLTKDNPLPFDTIGITQDLFERIVSGSNSFPPEENPITPTKSPDIARKITELLTAAYYLRLEQPQMAFINNGFAKLLLEHDTHLIHKPADFVVHATIINGLPKRIKRIILEQAEQKVPQSYHLSHTYNPPFPCQRVVLSHDKKIAALISGKSDFLKLVHRSKGTLIKQYEHAVDQFVFDPRDSSLCAFTRNLPTVSQLFWWNTKKGKPALLGSVKGVITHIVFTPHKEGSLIYGTEEGDIAVVEGIEHTNDKINYSFDSASTGTARINHIAFHPHDTSICAVAMGSQNIKLFFLEDIHTHETIEVTNYPLHLVYSPCGQKLVYSAKQSPDDTARFIQLLNVKDGTNLATINENSDVASLAYHPQQEIIAYSSCNGTKITLYDLKALNPLQEIIVAPLPHHQPFLTENCLQFIGEQDAPHLSYCHFQEYETGFPLTDLQLHHLMFIGYCLKENKKYHAIPELLRSNNSLALPREKQRIINWYVLQQQLKQKERGSSS